jgi:hypothetical protein
MAKTMDPKTRQALLDNIAPEDLEKIKAHQAKLENPYPVDNEWLILAEIAERYGWDAYVAVINDEVSREEIMTLLAASRKQDAYREYMDAQTSFLAAVSAKSKTPGNTFKRLAKGLLKRSKADE